MRRLSNPPPHRYTGAGFERAARRRLDAEWLSARRADPQSRVILLSGLEVLVSEDDQPCTQILTMARLGQPLPEEAIFLGEEDERHEKRRHSPPSIAGRNNPSVHHENQNFTCGGRSEPAVAVKVSMGLADG